MFVGSTGAIHRNYHICVWPACANVIKIYTS